MYLNGSCEWSSIGLGVPPGPNIFKSFIFTVEHGKYQILSQNLIGIICLSEPVNFWVLEVYTASGERINKSPHNGRSPGSSEFVQRVSNMIMDSEWTNTTVYILS